MFATAEMVQIMLQVPTLQEVAWKRSLRLNQTCGIAYSLLVSVATLEQLPHLAKYHMGKLQGELEERAVPGRDGQFSLHVAFFGNTAICHWQYCGKRTQIVFPLALSMNSSLCCKYNNIFIFFFGCFLKRKKSFHFDFTLRYQFLLGSLSHLLSLFHT